MQRPEPNPLQPDAPARLGGTPEAEGPAREAAPRAEPNGQPRCPNCTAPLGGAYCAHCGQKDQPLQQPTRQFVTDAVREYFGLDGRLWRSMYLLLLKPGALTVNYLEGRRRYYLRPLRIYLSCTLLFFFLLSLFDPTAAIVDVDADDVPDTLVTASSRLAVLDSLIERREGRMDRQALLVDSLRNVLALEQDSARRDSQAASGLLALPDTVESAERASIAAMLGEESRRLEDLADRIEDGVDRLENFQNETYQRWRWERSQIEPLSPDSLIVPLNYVEAAALLRAPPPEEEEGPFADPFADISNAPTARGKREAGRALARRVIGQIPTTMFLILPLFAFVLKVLYVRRNRFYSEHLVFALHIHAFTFFVFAMITLERGLAPEASWTAWLTAILVACIPLYVFVAMKRVYKQGWIKTILKYLILGNIYMTMLVSLGIAISFLLAWLVG